MNTISCGVDSGVAQSFASALWALDAVFEMARVGVAGVMRAFSKGAPVRIISPAFTGTSDLGSLFHQCGTEVLQDLHRTLANEPVYDELEIATLTWSLTRMRADLGADNPIVKRVFGKRSPAQIATDAVKHTRLKDLQVDAHGNATGGYRKQLWDGGKAAVDASHDPMIELARALDPDARAIRKKVETEVDGPMKRQQELLAKARFAVYGDSKYPDATFTLRLSYGTVKGWTEGDHPVKPFTDFAGAFDRATGADPFQLPDSWIKDKTKLDLGTPFDVVTTNDIIGGNSGSPLVNRKGEVAGLIFDGNIHSLGGDYGYDPALNRAVAVDSAALLEAMDKVYGAGRLVKEIKGSTTRLAADKVPSGQ